MIITFCVQFAMDGCHEFYRLYNMYICRRVSTSVQNSLLLLNVIKMNCIGCMSASHSWPHPHFLEGHDGSIHLCWRAQVAPTVRFGHAASPWCLGNAVPHKYSQIIAFWNARFNQIYKSAGPASGQWKRGIFCKPFAWLIRQGIRRLRLHGPGRGAFLLPHRAVPATFWWRWGIRSNPIVMQAESTLSI